MKTLKKLNLVSFKLDKLLESSGISISDELAKELQSVNEELTMKKTKSKSSKLPKIKLKSKNS